VLQNYVFLNQFPVHPHCAVICAREKKEKKKTPPNKIAQLTDYVISRTKDVLRFWFVVNTKLKRRGLPDTEQGGKKKLVT
jgi:hypothetical protein